jgi:hypothetical protein
MKCAIEMGSGAIISAPNFIKIGSGVQQLIGADSETHGRHGGLITLLLFFSK